MFRKRSNFFEVLLNFLKKALEEELVRDMNEWCFEIFEWLQFRNNTIVGPRQVMNKTNAGLKLLFNFEQQEDSENVEEAESNKVTLIPKVRLSTSRLDSDFFLSVITNPCGILGSAWKGKANLCVQSKAQTPNKKIQVHYTGRFGSSAQNWNGSQAKGGDRLYLLPVSDQARQLATTGKTEENIGWRGLAQVGLLCHLGAEQLRYSDEQNTPGEETFRLSLSLDFLIMLLDVK